MRNLTFLFYCKRCHEEMVHKNTEMFQKPNQVVCEVLVFECRKCERLVARELPQSQEEEILTRSRP
jgi:hypothetical protein